MISLCKVNQFSSCSFHLWRNMLFAPVFIEHMKERLDNTHLWVMKVVGKLVGVAIRLA